MVNFFLVFLGGGIGSVLRFLLGQWLNQGFPWGTLLVNLLGCLVIGAAAEIFARMGALDASVRFFFITGLLGGFTTYSSFSQETFRMMQAGEVTAFYYIAVTVVGGLILNFCGWKLASIFR